MENDKKEFALEEYKTLRKEISSKMDKQYQILSLGVGGITVIFGAIFSYHVYLLLFVLPFLIFANAHIYRAETHAIINAGDYIRRIENAVYRNGTDCNIFKTNEAFGEMGWENDIERPIYKPFEYATDVIFGSLYIFCVIGAGVWYWYKRPYYIPCAMFYSAMGVYVLMAVFWGYCIVKDELNKSKKGRKNDKASKNKE